MSGELCLRFQTGEDHRYIQPYRGFLLQLIPVGCSPDTPVILSDLAYLVEHNESQATYRCRSGLEFPGGQGDTVTLTCSGHQYDRPLPQCVAKIDSGQAPEVTSDSRASTAMLHDVILPTVVTMFTVILSIAACILLLIIKRQWETYPEFDQHQQVREITARMPLKRPLSVKRNFKSKDIDCLK